jgi:hypothetical protein
VLENKGLAVIIHENRFTYEAKGINKWTISVNTGTTYWYAIPSWRIESEKE